MIKEITVDASLDSMGAVMEFVDNELDRLECPPKAHMQIDIAIDEIFSNIAKYAYDGEKGDATVKVEVIQDPLSVAIYFLDAGTPFDPLKVQDPDISLKASERSIGGLGILLVKKTMDEVSYEYKDGKNILMIRKSIA